jgi:hypothetical protein
MARAVRARDVEGELAIRDVAQALDRIGPDDVEFVKVLSRLRVLPCLQRKGPLPERRLTRVFATGGSPNQRSKE